MIDNGAAMGEYDHFGKFLDDYMGEHFRARYETHKGAGRAFRLEAPAEEVAAVLAELEAFLAERMDELGLRPVDELGLDELDRKVLRTVIEKFGGGPVGLETIAASLSEEGDTIMDVVEPYLLQLGFLDRTPRGRVATRRACEHLGLPFPGDAAPQQATLF
jgi:Holliday junction DNA helicase RuvB